MAFGDFTVDRNSTKYVLGSGGTIISYATDEPAFEFNADGSYKGLLVEPAATNSNTYSEDFSDASYGASSYNSTVTTESITAPNGDSTVQKVGSTDGTNLARLLKTVSLGSTGTVSVFAKAAELNTIKLGTSPASADAITFNLATETFSAIGANVTNYSFDAYPNGWYRVQVNCSTNVSNIDIRIESPTAVGDGIYLWGAQVEASPIATSYIPTTTASVTRTKDDITLGSASSLIGQTEGTLYIEVDWQLATGTNQRLLVVSDGSGSNRISIYNRDSPVQLRMLGLANNATLTDQGVDSSGFSSIQKIAFAYKTNDFELYRNGSSISTDTSGSLTALATLTDIDVGQKYDDVHQANMWIRAVALYPKRLSDAEAQALTTL